MKIVLDSNIICQDYHLQSTQFRRFFDGLKLACGELLVPEVVIDEVVNCFREDLLHAFEKLTQAERDTARLVSDRRFKLRPVINQSQEVDNYKNELMQHIEKVGARILPYPLLAHKQVVERDLQRKKPFKRDGSGYRDLLIWESFKEYLGFLKHDEVVFITANKTDFGEGPRIDTDFHAEIYDSNRLTIYSSLKTFNEHYISPRLPRLDELKSALNDNNVKGFDVMAWLNDNLFETLKELDIKSIVTGLPTDFGELELNALKSYNDFHVTEVQQMGAGQKFVQIAVNVEVECSISIDWNEAKENKQILNWVQTLPDDFRIWAHTVELYITITFILNEDNSRVLSASIGPIDGKYGCLDIDGTIYLHPEPS